MARKAVFGLVAAALFFGLVELSLLLVGVEPIRYADDPYVGFSSRLPLFVEQAGADGRPWMTTAQNKQSLFNRQRFPRRKDAGTYRIFCLGGSTAFGHPYDDPTSFCGWLRELLPAADPSRAWEAINAGGISYASYREALLMEELVGYEPDLFVVLTGHNEFLERRTYAGLLRSPRWVRELDLGLSRTRSYSLIRRALRGSSPGPAPRRDLLPAEVDALLDHAIGPDDYRRDDELHEKVIAHYRFNLSRMVGIARSVGAQVLFVAPASNLADCSPFKSEHAAGPGSPERLRHEQRKAAADVAVATQRPAEALALVDEALALDARCAAAQFLRGRALRALGRNREAGEAFRRARDEDVCPLRATTSMCAIVRETAAQRDAPWVDFEALVARRAASGVPGRESFLDHVHPTIEVNRLLALAILERLAADGVVRPSAGWGEEAVRRVTLEVEGRIDRFAHAIALRNLANVLTWAGKVGEAERLAREAAELAPDDPTTHNQLGVTLVDSGDVDGAERQFRRALALDPTFALAHNNLGVILEGRGELEAAAEHYRSAVAHRPDYVEAYNNLGLVSIRLRRQDEAQRALESALDLNPDHVRARGNMATLLVARGDLEGAVAHLERALRIDPGSLEAHNNLGIVLYDLGRNAAARAHFEQAIRLEPDDPEAYNNLGATFEREGDVARALVEYRRAVAADPAHAAARANLARLQGAPGGGAER